jgi:hypothetical protein
LPKPMSPNRLPILSRLLRHRFIPPTDRLRRNEAGLQEIQWSACLSRRDTNPQDGSNWFVLFIWFIWSVWFNQTNKTNQITVFFCWRTFSASC